MFSDISEKLTAFITNKIELVKLEILEEINKILFFVYKKAFLVLSITLSIIFISICLAIVLNNLMGNNWSGFLILAVFYSLISLILYFYKKQG